jgi:tetratricopeptide (TPR) repeat protein
VSAKVIELPRRYGPIAKRSRRSVTSRSKCKVIRMHCSVAASDVLYRRASNLDESKATEETAIALYQEAIRLDATNALAWTNLGNCHFRAKRYDQAMWHFEQALSYDPHQPEALNNLAHVAQTQGRHQDAIEGYVRALAEDPEFADAWYNLGLCQEEWHLYEASHESFRRFLALEPDSEWSEAVRRKLTR